MLAINASPESHIRLKHAQDIAESCPESLFAEIALTGSSARGIATDSSDIEINFWVDKLPDLQSRVDWIRSLGVENLIAHTEPRPDNSYWINGIYKGIELEAGWQSFTDLDIALTEIIEARTTDHKTLRLAELILSSKHLRGAAVLQQWQRILQDYPSELSHKLIDAALTNWLSATWLENRLRANSLQDDIHRVWRLIFALNHQWEINLKYAHHSLSAIKLYPKNVTERVWEIQQMPVDKAINPMLNLIKDTLELIKTNYPNSDLLSENLNYLQNLL